MSASPQVIAASYDAFTDTFVLTFNRDMDAFVNPISVELSVDNGSVDIVFVGIVDTCYLIIEAFHWC